MYLKKHIIAIPALLATYTNAQSTESLITSAAKMAQALKSTFPNPGLALVPQPYWWWESGISVDALFTYGLVTGDRQYESLLITTIYSQATPTHDFMTADATGNDDQAWWALAALTAAETNVPVRAGEPAFLALARNVFNEQKARWDSDRCDGGLKWKINIGNGMDGWHYKSTITNGLFFQLAARLAKLTDSADALEWAERAYEWVVNVGLIDDEYNVFDGTDDTKGENGCVDVNRDQWSYNGGVFLYGAAVMAAHTGSTVWLERTKGLLAAAQRNFVRDGALFETKCEGDGSCNLDQVSFKGILARWMGATAVLLPDLREDIAKTLGGAAVKVQGSWDASLNAMEHYKGVEIMDATVRARGETVSAQGIIGARRALAGRFWVTV